jgi:hypothetical protein
MNGQTILEALREIITNPLAILTTLVAIGAWLLVLREKRSARLALEAAAVAPSSERAAALQALGISLSDIVALPATHRLNFLSRRFLLLAYLSSLIAFIIYQALIASAITKLTLDSALTELENPLRGGPATQLTELIQSHLDKRFSIFPEDAAHQYSGVVVVRAPLSAQLEINNLLNAIREELGLAVKGLSVQGIDSDTVRAINVISEVTTVEFVETPLTEVLAYLSDYHGVVIFADAMAFLEQGIVEDTPVTMEMKSVPLRAVLEHLAREHNAAFSFDNGRIIITTKEELSEQFGVTMVHDIRDLIEYARQQRKK